MPTNPSRTHDYTHIIFTNDSTVFTITKQSVHGKREYLFPYIRKRALSHESKNLQSREAELMTRVAFVF